MYIKIYFDDKPVYLCNEINEEIKRLLHHPGTIFKDEISKKAIHAVLHEINKETFHAGVIWSNDLEQLKKVFFKNFTPIEAAGGIVHNMHEEILFIYRLGKWDLPKGKMEEHEKPDECALREVEEETAVTDLVLQKKIGETYHTYQAYGKHFIKTTHWYFMKTNTDNTLQPQAEEDITDAKWIDVKNINIPLENSYASIKEIVEVFLKD